MNNPVVFECPKGTWVKIATGITNGTVYRLTAANKYIQTYRVTGDAAPTTKDDGAQLFGVEDQNSARIICDTAADIYVMCVSQDGSVRIDT